MTDDLKEIAAAAREVKAARSRVLHRPAILDERPPADPRKRERWLHERELAERAFMDGILAKDANRLTPDEHGRLLAETIQAAKAFKEGTLE